MLVIHTVPLTWIPRHWDPQNSSYTHIHSCHQNLIHSCSPPSHQSPLCNLMSNVLLVYGAHFIFLDASFYLAHFCPVSLSFPQDVELCAQPDDNVYALNARSATHRLCELMLIYLPLLNPVFLFMSGNLNPVLVDFETEMKEVHSMHNVQWILGKIVLSSVQLSR